jgi:3-methylcrotonyl-CoA carboxylase alpha subunit
LLQERAMAVRSSGWIDPWARRDGWQSFSLNQRRFDFEFHGEAVAASLTYLHDGATKLKVGQGKGLGAAAELLTFDLLPEGIDVQFAGQRQVLTVYQKSDVAHIHSAQGATQIVAIDVLAHAGDSQADAGRLTAPMPGKVVSFNVKAGDKVVKGQALAIMDAMKMEHTIAAPVDGTVAELLFAPGDQVAEGTELLKLSAAEHANL